MIRIRRPAFAAAAGLALLALLAVGGAWLYLAPQVAAKHYLTTTYAASRPFRDIRVDVLELGPGRADLRVSVHFEIDPDYGFPEDPATWHEYASLVSLVRGGLSWLPAAGRLLPGDRASGFFNWVATDPITERTRGPRPCT